MPFTTVNRKDAGVRIQSANKRRDALIHPRIDLDGHFMVAHAVILHRRRRRPRHELDGFKWLASGK